MLHQVSNVAQFSTIFLKNKLKIKKSVTYEIARMSKQIYPQHSTKFFWCCHSINIFGLHITYFTRGAVLYIPYLSSTVLNAFALVIFKSTRGLEIITYCIITWQCKVEHLLAISTTPKKVMQITDMYVFTLHYTAKGL